MRLNIKHEKRQLSDVKSASGHALHRTTQSHQRLRENHVGGSPGQQQPRVPSPIVSQERSLPTELWVHALEYTSWDDALVAIDVSKAFRSASRFALNKGRWAPVVKVVLAVKSFPWHRHGFDRRNHLDDVKAQISAPRGTRGSRSFSRQIMDSVDYYQLRTWSAFWVRSSALPSRR